MSRRMAAAVLTLVGVLALEEGTASPPSSAGRYPRVYGATGRPYGPTQAHYQYRRRYGRPWHGYGGVRTAAANRYRGVPAHSGSYNTPVGYGFGSFGIGPFFPGYGYNGFAGVTGPFNTGPYYSSIPMAPVAIQAYPLWIGRNPFHNSVLQRAQFENDRRWNRPLQIAPVAKRLRRSRMPSSPLARQRSLRARMQGDMHLRQQRYSRAYDRYKAAVRFAGDRADAHFRLGFTLAALGHFPRAVNSFKRGLSVNPNWPTTGESFGRIFGRNNLVARIEILHRVTLWVKEDIRDPDRLFLLGVLLHFDNQADKASLLFETAFRLAGRGDHLIAFLRPTTTVAAKNPVAKKPAVKNPVVGFKPQVKAPPPQRNILTPPLPIQ